MAVRKMMTAALVAGGIALTPGVAIAGAPIAVVVVGGSSSSVSYSVESTMVAADLTLNVFGSPVNVNCSSGDLSGGLNGGTGGLSPDPTFEFNEFTLHCDSFIPGTWIEVSLDNCPIDVVMDDADVNAGVVDTDNGPTYSPVDGTALLTDRFDPTNHCMLIEIQSPSSSGPPTTLCEVRVGGESEVRFDEKSIGSPRYQRMTFSAGDLSEQGIPPGCLGSVPSSRVVLNAAFNIRVVGPSNKLIDFAP